MDDPEAAMMRVLYDEHAGALWRYVVRLTGDAARAEDVVQETLLRAWRHPEVTYDADRSARAWLFTVARNLIIDERRSARFRNETGTPDIEGSPTGQVPTRWTTHWTGYCSATAMSELSEDHRAVILPGVLPGPERRADRRTTLQIAEGTVKSRLHYAVRALRLNLQEMGVTR